MSLALIAGSGALPPALLRELERPPLVCALEGARPSIPVALRFRLERLGGFVAALRARGVARVCMAGGIERPRIDWRAFDLATLRLVPVMLRALRAGDDGALRAFIGVLEAGGLQVVGAHQIAPGLVARAGVPTETAPGPAHRKMAATGERHLADMGRRDSGQACVLRDGRVVAEEDVRGTDALIARAAGAGGLLFKGPKPAQDRRADLPTVGPETARGIVAAGLDGLVVEAGGTLLLDAAETVSILNAAGRFLWVRERGA